MPFEAADLSSWLGIVAFLLGIAVAIKVLFQRSRTSPPLPQPLSVEFTKEFVAKEDFDELKVEVRSNRDRSDGALESIKTALQEGFRAEREAWKASISGVYQTMEKRLARMQEEDVRTRERLAAIENQNETFKTMLSEQKATLDDILRAIREQKR